MLTSEAYMDSRYEPLRGDRGMRHAIHSAVMSWRYPDFLRHVRHGIGHVGLLTTAVRSTVSRMRSGSLAPEVAALATRLTESAERAAEALPARGEHAPPRALYRADRRLRGEDQVHVRSCLAALYELDALSAMAATSERPGWSVPEVLDLPTRTVLHMTGLVHPLVREPVANDLAFESDGDRVMFLTGPNMAGKTTLMKAIGVAVYCAQLGMAAPAASMRFTPFHGILSSIGQVDSVAQGISHFMSEARRALAAVKLACGRRRALLLFDELFRGTNVLDSTEASERILTGLAKCRLACVVASSHVPELADRLAPVPNVGLWQFEFALEGDTVRHDFRVRPGVFRKRAALSILDATGLMAALEELDRGNVAHARKVEA